MSFVSCANKPLADARGSVRSHRITIRFVSAILLGGIFVAGLFAQGGQVVRGRVKDAQGGVIANAQVHLFRRDTGVSWNAVTNKAGEYRFDGVASGSFVLEVQKQGFRSATLDIQLERAGSKPFDVVLGVAGVNQTV